MRIEPIDLSPPLAGQRLADLLLPHGAMLRPGDVVVVDSGVVSVAEANTVRMASHDDRDAIVAAGSSAILRRRHTDVLSETTHGFVLPDAGVRWPATLPGTAVLLPRDPERAAHKIADGIRTRLDVEVHVIVATWFEDPWRHGRRYGAIGCAGVPALGTEGRAYADAIAAAAALVMGDNLAAFVRGVSPASDDATPLLRAVRDQAFR